MASDKKKEKRRNRTKEQAKRARVTKVQVNKNKFDITHETLIDMLEVESEMRRVAESVNAYCRQLEEK